MGRLTKTYDAVRDTLRFDGISILLWKIFQRATHSLWTIEGEIWFRKDLTKPLTPVEPRLPITIHEATVPDVPQLAALELEPHRHMHPQRFAHELRMRRKIYADDVGLGEKFFVAAMGSEVVHLNWTHYFAMRPAFGYPVLLGPEEVVTTGAFTPAHWRGRGIHAVVLHHMLRVAQQNGRKVAYTTTMLFNRRSRKGIQKVGWIRCGTLIYGHRRGGDRIYCAWYGTHRAPLPWLQTDDQRRVARRVISFGRASCIVLAIYRQTPTL